MKHIPLGKGIFAVVDDSDFDSLIIYHWYPFKSRNSTYAVRAVWENGKTSHELMHRRILGVASGVKLDHKDGDGLNNQWCNLRKATTSQNGFNRGIASHNSSGFKGVTWNKKQSKWVAQIKSACRHFWLGHFDDPRQAALAYDAACERLHGSFAVTNSKLGLL